RSRASAKRCSRVRKSRSIAPAATTLRDSLRMPAAGTLRLDAAVAERAGVTRSQARSLIMEGRARVDGIVATKAGQSAKASATIEVERPRRFVSRGGEKLDYALDAF